MPKTTSYGVLIFNEQHQLLVAHVTGKHVWDIPKGGAESGEAPIEAAVRETFEETGVVLNPGDLQDLGLHPYLPAKDLHLFYTAVTRTDLDIASCRCTSFFAHHRTGKPTPEVDAFRWIPQDAIASHCSPRMAALLLSLLANGTAIPAATGGRLRREAP